MFYPTTFRKACQGEISTQKRKVLKYAKRQLSGTFPGRHSLLKDRIAETPNPALAFQFQRNVGRIKSFTRFFSKNRGSGEGRALSQAVTSRTSEAVHSCCTCNEACAAHKICLKQTTAAGGIPSGCHLRLYPLTIAKDAGTRYPIISQKRAAISPGEQFPWVLSSIRSIISIVRSLSPCPPSSSPIPPGIPSWPRRPPSPPEDAWA